MVEIFKGCKFNDLYIKSYTSGIVAFLYNEATNTSQELTLTLRENTEYIYDATIDEEDTINLECGVYNIEVLNSDNEMIGFIRNYARVVQSSKQNVPNG